ncbi:MAG TPA: sulfite exporter TauE/SafE family protein [Solirubrobacteraceae bacterium]|nr:sulfite exporter TauE/SafE family protein [Solirubrobacteraceae bacterium]
MSAFEILALLAAGVAAGTINTVVGSGTLISFPILLAFGFAPVTANVANTLGLAPGALTGAYGYRRELAGQGRRTARLAVGSVVGAVGGAILLLELPPSAFKAIVPGFIVVALVLIVAQPRISARLSARAHAAERERGRAGPGVFAGVLLTGVYGGYFGAAQGILLLALLSIGLDETLQRVNGVKNLLAGIANLVAGVVFVFIAPHVDWSAAGLIGAGSISGGLIGARYGRRLPPTALRALIVAVGIVAIVRLV